MDGVDALRGRARDAQRLHGLGEQGGNVEPERLDRPRTGPEIGSISAPDADYLAPLVGMSRDRMIGSLTRIEHMISRLQEREGTQGEPNEMTLARMMISEHLRRLRIVGAGEEAGPFGGVR